MRPPEFWKAEVAGRDAAHVLKALLTPVSWAYAAVAAHRQRTTISRHAPVPVVCIGNFTVGGAGKTPNSRAVRAKLGPHAHTLSRGYGGRAIGPLRVTPDMEAIEVGDEPLLHATDGAAWVSRARFAGALAAAQAGAHVIVMDDGFQNPALAKDLCIVAVDPAYGVANRRGFPGGARREWLIKFCPKFVDQITHLRRLKNTKELLDEFLDAIYAFGNNLGPMFLMPHPQMAPQSIDTIQAFIESVPKDVQLFIELRHPAWYADKQVFDDAWSTFEKLKTGSVTTDASG